MVSARTDLLTSRAQLASRTPVLQASNKFQLRMVAESKGIDMNPLVENKREVSSAAAPRQLWGGLLP